MHGHALIDRLGSAFAALFFVVQMLVVAKAGHAMPGIPILAVLAAPFALYAVRGASPSDESDEQYVIASR